MATEDMMTLTKRERAELERQVGTRSQAGEVEVLRPDPPHYSRINWYRPRVPELGDPVDPGRAG